MAKSRSKKQISKPPASLALLPTPRGMLWIVVLVSALAAIMFFAGHAIFEAIGLGLFLLFLWMAVVVYVVWRQGMRSLFKWWNLWLGAIIFTLALWGIFALFLPNFSIANANFSQASLGGNFGRSFIGNQGAGAPPAARLIILFLIGIGLVVPRPSLRALRFLSQATKKFSLTVITSLRWLLPRLRQRAISIDRRFSLRLRKSSSGLL